MKPAGTAVGVLSTERVVNVDDDGKLSYSYPNKNVRLADSDYWKETIASVKSYHLQLFFYFLFIYTDFPRLNTQWLCHDISDFHPRIQAGSRVLENHLPRHL